MYVYYVNGVTIIPSINSKKHNLIEKGDVLFNNRKHIKSSHELSLYVVDTFNDSLEQRYGPDLIVGKDRRIKERRDLLTFKKNLGE